MNLKTKIELEVTERSSERLDKYISQRYPDITRSQIQKAIQSGEILVNSVTQKASYKVGTGDLISIMLDEPSTLSIEPQNIPLEIVYQDEAIAVINKPKQMVVHPAPGNETGTLVHALRYHFREDLSSINGELRPGIVHRIDKDTTGLLVIAKTNAAHEALQVAFQKHDIIREYTMIVLGSPKEDRYRVDAPIGRNPKDRLKMAVVAGGKRAVTHFRVIERYQGYALVKATLETGRTHQIRVHSAMTGHPILGDDLYYGGKYKIKTTGQVLHAGVLGFAHPVTGEWVVFHTDLPDYFQTICDQLRRGGYESVHHGRESDGARDYAHQPRNY